MLRRPQLCVPIVTLTAALAGADDTAVCSILRAAPRFAAGPVSYAGVISREEAALHNLLSEPNPSGDLRRLLSEATLAGQLYALWGLAIADKRNFRKLSEKYIAVDSEVDTMNGCIVGRERVSSIVKRIRAGEYGRPTN